MSGGRFMLVFASARSRSRSALTSCCRTKFPVVYLSFRKFELLYPPLPCCGRKFSTVTLRAAAGGEAIPISARRLLRYARNDRSQRVLHRLQLRTKATPYPLSIPSAAENFLLPLRLLPDLSGKCIFYRHSSRQSLIPDQHISQSLPLLERLPAKPFFTLRIF
jgi:hypothetical protein